MGKGKGNNYVPEKVTDALEDGKDAIKDEVGKWVPDLDIQKQLGNLYDSIKDLWERGYENIDVKGNYIDPWTDKVLDYADFNVVVPRSNKTFVKGSNKDDLMSGHWEKHKYEGGNGNDRIFTWYGKDTLIGGNGKDHLYADGDDCTMIGGNGKDYFYIEGGGTSLIKDYEKKDVIRVDGYGKGGIKISHKKGNSLIKAGNRTLAKVVGTKLSTKDLQYHGGSNKNYVLEDDHDHNDPSQAHSGHNHRSIDPADSGSLTDVLLGAV